MNEVQVKEIVRGIVREEFKQSLLEARGIPKLFLKIEAVKKEIDRLTAERKSKFGGEYAKKLNAETDTKKREQLKQPILAISKKITALQKNLGDLYDMEEKYIQNLDKDAELDLTEMSVNDVHFKNILRAYDHGGTFTKKKVAVAVCKNPNANRTKIIDYLKDMDYEEIIEVEDELRLGESVNELKTLPNGNYKIKKKYNTFAEYEPHAKIGDTILKYSKKSPSFRELMQTGDLHPNAKRYLSKVHSIGTDGVNLTLFGKQTPASVHPSDKKELAVVVLEGVVNEGKPDYEVYHKTYTSAIQAALDYAKKEGYDYDEEETAREIGMGPRKPSEGKTNKFHLSLKKNFKEQKKMLHIQVYGMKNSYELNAYIQ